MSAVMTADAVSLRAVSCKRWQWLGGILCVHTGHIQQPLTRCLGVDPFDELSFTGWYDDRAVFVSQKYAREHMRPVLTDPATLGCLQAMVRDAWADPGAHVLPDDSDPHKRTWTCWTAHDLRDFDGDTEAEALIAALEAAP